MKEEEFKEHCIAWGASDVLKQAEASDVFFLGVGRLDDDDYRRLMEDQLKISVSDVGAGATPHLVYRPLDQQHDWIVGGKFGRLQAVSVDALKRAAASASRHVVVLAGGARKIDAVKLLLRKSCLNVLVTDEDIAEACLTEVGG